MPRVVLQSTLRSLFVPLLTGALLGGAVATTWALDPTLPPGQNFDLSIYNLQTPLPGTPQIKQPQLATYTSNIFHTAADGAMVFWVPTAGVPLDAGGYPRTELRQLAPGGDWVVSNNVVHLLTATCKVLTNPPNKRIIIGQIHGNGTGSEALKLYWNNGTVQAAVKDNYGGTQIYLTVGTWALGATLSYSIQESNHLITVTVNGITVTNLLNSTWDVDRYYFKAGNYCQDNSTTTNTVGVVAFYALNTNVLGSVGAPAFSPPAGAYSTTQTVTLSTPTMGSSIRYTTNGSTPTPTTGTLYTSAVKISATTTLKAIAYDSILTNSLVTMGIYTIGTAPSITTGPTNQTVVAGQNATFTVVAAGTAPLAYQWRFNGTNIAGTTATNHSIVTAQTTNAGSYTVVVTNVAGSITSDVATLTVMILTAPQIRQSGLNLADGSLTLSGFGPTNQPWRVLVTTNILLASTNWTVLGTGVFSGGVFNCTDAETTSYDSRFYRVTTP